MISLTRTQLALVAVPLLVLLTVAGSRLAGVGANEGPSTVAPLARLDADGSGAGAAPRLVVHVVGAVRRPGLFRLEEGARVADAVQRAGGPTRRADLSVVNLAAPLADGQQVVVPRRGPPGAAPAGSPATPAKVSLAIATVDQLDELRNRPGHRTEDRRLEDRAWSFGSVEDLDDVPGIGPARVEQLRELVTP